MAVVAVVVLGAYSWLKGSYNDMVSRSEAATAQLGNIENQYQRRADLIPNLVSTVKGYAAHEQNTLEQVVEARAKATQTRIDVNDAAARRLPSALNATALMRSVWDAHSNRVCPAPSNTVTWDV